MSLQKDEKATAELSLPTYVESGSRRIWAAHRKKDAGWILRTFIVWCINQKRESDGETQRVFESLELRLGKNRSSGKANELLAVFHREDPPNEESGSPVTINFGSQYGTEQKPWEVDPAASDSSTWKTTREVFELMWNSELANYYRQRPGKPQDHVGPWDNPRSWIFKWFG